MFMASADRGCTIRERVELNGSQGIPSEEWIRPHTVTVRRDNPGGPQHAQFVHEDVIIKGINPAEWLLDPGAARAVG